MAHSVAIPSDLLETYYCHFPKQSSKALNTKHIHFLDNFEWEAYETNVCL
jgi:hypothetical protein